MIADLKPYAAVKNSGVPWLGDVPEHWEVRRLSQIGRLSKGNGGNKEDEVPVGVPCVRYGDLYTTHTYFILKSRSFVSPAKAEDYTPIAFGDVLFAASGETFDEIGKSAVNLMQSEACCGGDVVLFRPQYRVKARYMGYATDCRPAAAQKAAMGRGITVKHIYGDQLRYLTLALPPLPEQAAIVRFLDHADRLIRRYIRAKQKLIKLLEEQKQVIIHRAVTRGLDPNVPLKPSGVGWLGDVPEHWHLIQVRRLILFVTSGSRGWADFYADEGDIFLQSGNLGRSMALNWSFIQRVRPPNGAEGKRTRVERDDVLLCITGALTGNVVHVTDDLPEPSFVNQHVALIRPNRVATFPRYLAYALHSEIGRIQFKAGEYGGTKQGLGLDDVKSALVPLPPESEQRAICQQLDTAMVRHVASVAAIKREISLFHEYRTRLIADVVTGKLDVRAAAAALSDAVEQADDVEAIEEGAALAAEDDEEPMRPAAAAEG